MLEAKDTRFILLPQFRKDSGNNFFDKNIKIRA